MDKLAQPNSQREHSLVGFLPDILLCALLARVFCLAGEIWEG